MSCAAMSSFVPVVVLPYESRAGTLAGRERVAEQSRRAREALTVAADALDAVLGPLVKNAEDAPLPANGWHWSLSHGTHFAAAALARSAVGVDVEWIRPRSQAIVPRVTSREEIDLCGGFSWETFFRVWTAKEAVLKKSGCGILELSRCVLVAVPDGTTLVLRHRERDHLVHQFRREEHVVSVSHDEGSHALVDWRWNPLAARAAGGIP
jgi:4'-phosphopantetheinyl transferase